MSDHKHAEKKWHGKGMAPILPVSHLAGIYSGRDVWIIGSAASMTHVAPSFFENKVVIGINYAYRDFPCNWVVAKDFCQTEYNELGSFLILSRHLWGMYSEGQFGFFGHEPFYVFDHVDNQQDQIDLSVIGTDKVFVGKSSLTSAMHVAAIMGAANIMLCGVDGGTLDGNLQYENYHSKARGDDVAFYRDFVAKIMWQTRAVRDRLFAVYGCRTYSLNPFIGFNMEGHVYECLDPGQRDVSPHSGEEPAASRQDAATGVGDLEGEKLDS